MADLTQIRRRNFGDFWTKFYGGPCTEAEFYACVLRNLLEIFTDHRRPLTPEQEAEFPEARDSVINRAVRDFSSGHFEPADYANHMAWAIRAFEERLDPQTVTVRYVQFAEKNAKAEWVFRIDGDLWTERGGQTFRCYVAFDLDGRAGIFT